MKLVIRARLYKADVARLPIEKKQVMRGGKIFQQGFHVNPNQESANLVSDGEYRTVTGAAKLLSRNIPLRHRLTLSDVVQLKKIIDAGIEKGWRLKLGDIHKLSASLGDIASRMTGKVTKSVEVIRSKEWFSLNGVKYVLVDGEDVRNNPKGEHLQFTEGGHHYRYGFIPTNEIWIESRLKKQGRQAAALHEAVERQLMIRFNMSYDTAHEMASKVEASLREMFTPDDKALTDEGLQKRIETAIEFLSAEKSLSPIVQEMKGELLKAISIKRYRKINPKLRRKHKMVIRRGRPVMTTVLVNNLLEEQKK